jgi:putative transposase
MAKSRYRVVTDGSEPYFLTCTVVNWLPLFGNPKIAEIVIESLRFLHEQGRMSLHGYVVMENHLHLIASAGDLRKELGDFKSFTARRCIDWFREHRKEWVLRQLAFHKLPHKVDQEYQFWQEGAHPQLVQGEAMLREKLEYIHHNPVKRGYVDDPAHWRYSSHRNYMGLEGVLPVVSLF